MSSSAWVVARGAVGGGEVGSITARPRRSRGRPQSEKPESCSGSDRTDAHARRRLRVGIARRALGRRQHDPAVGPRAHCVHPGARIKNRAPTATLSAQREYAGLMVDNNSLETSWYCERFGGRRTTHASYSRRSSAAESRSSHLLRNMAEGESTLQVATETRRRALEALETASDHAPSMA
jgi:hypothetical protein